MADVWDPSIGMNSKLSDALQELITRYNSTAAYQGKTADEIQTQATGETQSYYDQLRLAAQQSQAQSDLALQQQREGLGRSYDNALDASRRQYAQAYSQADRAMQGRGMARSSYAGQTLGNLARQGVQAQNDIWSQRVQAEGNIDAQRAQLGQQLAQQLAQYDVSQANDIQKRIKELQDQEYERKVANQNTMNQLSTQIYEYLAAQQKKSGGGGSSSTSSTSTTTTPTTYTGSWSDFTAALSGAGNTLTGFFGNLFGNQNTNQNQNQRTTPPYHDPTGQLRVRD